MIKITDVEKVTEETLERDFSEFEKKKVVEMAWKNCKRREDGELVGDRALLEAEKRLEMTALKNELGDLKEQNKDVCRHCGKTKEKHFKDNIGDAEIAYLFCYKDSCKSKFEPEPAQEEAIKRIKSFLAMRKAEGKREVSGYGRKEVCFEGDL